MPTEIKAIKCPQCGSADKTALGENHYQCKKCGTEYFLDNDDIHIIVSQDNGTNSYTNWNAKKPISTWKVLVFVGVMLAVFFCIFLIFVFTSGNNNVSSYVNSYGMKGGPEMATPIVVKGKPYILVLSRDISYSPDKNKDIDYFTFMDATLGKVVKSEKFTGLNVNSSNLSGVTFADGKTYITDKQKIFEVDNDDMNLQDVTTSMFAGDSLYASGIASVEIDNIYNCFKIMTNLGQQYYYYPIVKKSHLADSKIYKIEKTVQPNATDTTVFNFTEKTFDDDPINDKVEEHELLKIKYKYNNGDVQRAFISPRWMSINNYEYPVFDNSEFLVSYTNLTPGRLYFNPKIACQDTNYLLIAVSATAAENSTISLQRINTQTGALMWSLPIEPQRRELYGLKESIHADNKFLVKLDNGYFLVVDDNGKIIRYIDLFKNS